MMMVAFRPTIHLLETTGAYQVIYALGLRNPFSMDIDPVSGRILVGDVGKDDFEEINNIRAGRNYGWPLIEGPRKNQTAPVNYVDPIYAYTHKPECAVAGLAIYNTPVQFVSRLNKAEAFFADYCSGIILPSTRQRADNGNKFVTGIDRPVALATSPDGYLYYIARGGTGGGSTVEQFGKLMDRCTRYPTSIRACLT